MRPDGNRHWPRRARRALLLTTAFVALGATPAAAADRYAIPAGGATVGDCGEGSPCTLKRAIEGAAQGQTVEVTPGTYTVTAPISGGGVTITGGTSDNTLINGSATLTGGPVLALDNSATVKHLTVESHNSQLALDLAGSGENLQVYNRTGSAMVLRGGSTLTSSVVHSAAANATALQISGGLISTTTVRRSTLVATGSNSRGLDASGLLAGATVRSSIVTGVDQDVVGALLNSVTLSYSAWRAAKSSYTSNGGSNYDGTATFTDPAGLKFDQDLSSPTINRGEADGATTDITGRQRPIGSAPDIGAYEAPLPPVATTGSASNLQPTSAMVEITTNARTVASQRWIEYGTDPASLDQEAGRGSAGSTASNVTTQLAMTGLLPGTTYHYRAVASNTWGRTEGATLSFSTLEAPPVPVTAPAQGVTAAGATLAGKVDRGGGATTAWFEWGETASYGNTSAVQDLGDGPDAVDMSGVALSGLQPNTEYHYRVVAENSKGRVQSLDTTFRTAVREPAVTAGTASGITTSGATLSGTVDAGGDDTDWRIEYGIGDYDTVGGTGTVTGASPQAVSGTLTGLLPGTTYQYRLIASNDAGPRTVTGTFTTQVAMPTFHSVVADPVGPRSATIGTEINVGGSSATWQVEYGPTAAYGSVSGPHAQARTTSDVDVQTVLQDLDPVTTYHYRVVVTNSKGTVYGGDATLTTPADSPGVTTVRAHGIGRTAAHVDATVDPGGADTDWRIEYGTSAAYGQTTSTGTIAAAKAPRDVTAKLEGLQPGTTYHYRVVAANSAGDRAGTDKTFTTDAPEPPPPPKAPTPVDEDDVTEPGTGGAPTREPDPGERTADGLPAPRPAPPVGESANAAPAGGTVRVRIPGSDEYVTLTEGAGIPVGSVVDATQGQVTITSAADAHGRTQSANFGGSQFKILQKRAARPITDIVLTGGSMGCAIPRSLSKPIGGDVFAAERRKYSRRRLWGNGHGRFRTRGRRATATVRGTHWLTEDRCDGTLVRVKRGLVEVRDTVRRKKVMVPAGERYFAKAKLTKREKRALKRKRSRR